MHSVFFPGLGDRKLEGIGLRGERINGNLRSNLFTQRVVYMWNELPEEVVEAGTLTTFKRHLERDTGKWG